MKTTIEIDQALFARARSFARKHGLTFRSLVEEGLRLRLDRGIEEHRAAYELPDQSVGDASAPNPLESLSWPELRGLMYDGGKA